MRRPSLFRLLILSLVFLAASGSAYSQRYLAEYDSTFFIRDTLRPFLKRMENLNFSGYIQPQFQVAQTRGINSYAGGNFPELSKSRFMLRRARFRADYRMPGKSGSFPAALFTVQY